MTLRLFLKPATAIIFAAFAFAVISCSEEDPEPAVPTNPEPVLDDNDLAIIQYFHEVALGFGTTNPIPNTRKWTSSMKVYMGGSPTQTHLDELTKVISEINALVTDGFKIELVQDSALCNNYIYVGDRDTYNLMYPRLKDALPNSSGLVSVYFGTESQVISRSHIFVSNGSSTLHQRHVIREELTQSLGLMRDSHSYENSIFQEDYSDVTEYADIDRELVRLLYHPSMTAKLDSAAAEGVLREVLLSEKVN